eukprot:CAMPEP_0116999950 /NCGR_PEP_ID=MMETSP0472-20121206/2469_1 /TAXON_ID=693140 ORGANISM="Tiarina fusus, Strain LIS" /NCGR_SAMPLE_ID=MMETSP0472 /ASSEMBLY_ACC=CAM_ASM_000603 /LENGTH=800 /DNA_ID=CAMNT_0004699509 /DNA_START=105 /DNA_END=2508 /DNA_ORIENTATION=-
MTYGSAASSFQTRNVFLWVTQFGFLALGVVASTRSANAGAAFRRVEAGKRHHPSARFNSTNEIPSSEQSTSSAWHTEEEELPRTCRAFVDEPKDLSNSFDPPHVEVDARQGRAGSSSPQGKGMKGYALQEIVSVQIQQGSSPSEGKERDGAGINSHKLLLDPNNYSGYYVRFLHGNGDRNSLSTSHSRMLEPLYVEQSNTKPTSCAARVDWHVRLEDVKPLKCKIYRTRLPFLSDELVGVATFSPSELEASADTAGEETVIVAPVTRQGLAKSATGATLQLQLRRKEWSREFDIQVPKPKSDIEAFFKMLQTVLPMACKKTNNPSADKLSPPHKPADPNLPMIEFLDGAMSFPREGECATVTRSTRIQMAIMNLLPFTDRQTPYRNRNDGIHEVRHRTLGDLILKPREGLWSSLNSDATMTRVFFSSQGQFCLVKDDATGGYISDTTCFRHYKHRSRPGNKPYQPYGCKAFFDKDGAIIKIEDTDGDVYHPGDEHWQWAKQLARSSVFAYVAMLHIAQVHYIWGNIPGTAMRMFLEPDHPLVGDFSVHFFKTAYTCTRARYSLFDPRGILYRGTSFEYEGGLEELFKDLLVDFRFNHFPTELEKAGVADCDFLVANKDGVDLHTIMMNYVSSYVDHLYEDEEALQRDKSLRKCHKYIMANMKFVPELQAYKQFNKDSVKKFWGEILFRVTGYHAAVGQVTGWALDPTMTNLRIEKKETENMVATKESGIAVAMITAITTVPCPKLGEDWRQVFGEDNVPTCYDQLRKDLDDLQSIIDERNKHRDVNVDFHPRHCALSISS